MIPNYYLQIYKRNVQNYIIMLDGLIAQCKGQKQAFENANFVVIEQNQYQHSDFIVVGWLLYELAKQKKVTFISFRENYAHFLGLSKKLGKSIEGYIKNKQLTYIECFQAPICSQLPLTQNPPQTYTSPPSMALKISAQDLMDHQQLIKNGQTIVIDSINFIDENTELCFWIYEKSMINKCRLIMGGCLDMSQVTKMLQFQADIIVRLQNDVGGFGKLSVKTEMLKTNVLWKNINCRLEFSQHISI